MSVSRKMRRKLSRSIPAGADAEQVKRTLAAMQVAAEEQTVNKIYNKLKHDKRSQIEAYRNGVVDTLSGIVGYMRDGKLGGKPFGKQRLENFIQGFFEYQAALCEGKVTTADIEDSIKEETGWSLFDSINRAAGIKEDKNGD